MLNSGNVESSNDVAAGKPTHWEDRKQSYAGRRSRRNSFSEDSQVYKLLELIQLILVIELYY